MQESAIQKSEKYSFNDVSHHFFSLMKIYLQWPHQKPIELECGPMPNVMVALPNIGGTLCSMPQSLARAHCSIAVQ